MKRCLELNYTVEEGWLSTWLDGLRVGKAIASTCSTCDAVQFPPLRACPKCRTPSDGWRTLDGGATVLFRTNGTDGDFAMVQFDGASSAAIARSDALATEATRAMLAPSSVDPPQLSLSPEL